MAIVLTSKFNPFTYDELVRPAMEMTKAHQEVEQALGELKAESMKMQNLANKETDPIAHAQYQRYASDLALQAASLARSGLRTSSRRDLYDMASRYQAEIVPIDTASKKREALANQQRALRLQNPTMLFEREAAGMSLDELIQNPNADYGHAISGDFLAKQVATAASVLAKEARDSEEGKGKLKKMMLPFQYEYIKQKGFSREAVMEAILRGPNANKILTGIVDGVIKSSGVLDWGDRNTIAKAYNYANQGLYSAIGETTSQIVTDTYGAQRAAARAAARANATPTGVKGGRVNPVPLRSKLGLAQANQDIERYKNLGYVTLDKSKGHYVLTKKGENALLAVKEPIQKDIDYANSGMHRKIGNDYYHIKDPKFFDALKSANGGKAVYITTTKTKGSHYFDAGTSKTTYHGTTGPGNAGLLFQKYMKDNEEGSYDTYRSTAYRQQLSAEEGKQLKSAITGAITGEIEEVDFNGKDGFKGTGTKLSEKDLEGYTAIYQDVTKYGIVATLIKDGSKTVQVMVPKSIAPTYYNNAVSLASQAQEMSVYDKHGYYPIQDAEGNIDRVVQQLNAADKAKAQKAIDALLWDMDAYGSAIRTTTENTGIKYPGF